VKKSASLLALLVGFAALPAFAATNSYSSQAYGTNTNNSGTGYAAPAYATPDTVAASFGGYDFDKDGNSRQSVDYRLDYQWGVSLLPMMASDWAGSQKYVQLHPVAGFEGTGDGATYINGGLNLDVPIPETPLVFTWGEAIGWYGHGDSAQGLGSPFEMRSQVELGWEFDNHMRLGAYFSHLSNMGAGDDNPGGEILGGTLRIPVGWLAHEAK